MSAEVFSGFVGLFMPYVVEFMKAKLPETKGKWLGYVTSLSVSAIVGGVGSVLEGQVTSDQLLSSMGTALIASQGVYNLWFKPKKIDEKVYKTFQ